MLPLHQPEWRGVSAASEMEREDEQEREAGLAWRGVHPHAHAGVREVSLGGVLRERWPSKTEERLGRSLARVCRWDGLVMPKPHVLLEARPRKTLSGISTSNGLESRVSGVPSTGCGLQRIRAQ